MDIVIYGFPTRVLRGIPPVPAILHAGEFGYNLLSIIRIIHSVERRKEHAMESQQLARFSHQAAASV